MKTALWDKILPDWQKSMKKWPQNAFSKWFGKSEKTNVKVQFIRKMQKRRENQKQNRKYDCFKNKRGEK